MAETLLVIVGEWECLENGNWHFKVSTETYAKCVALRSNDSYKDLMEKIITGFGLSPIHDSLTLSYWCIGDEVAFTQVKMPPVLIDDDVGLENFKQKRLENKRLNMYVTIKKHHQSETTNRARMISNTIFEQEAYVPQVAEVFENPLTFVDEIFIQELEELEKVHKKMKTSTDCGEEVGSVRLKKRKDMCLSLSETGGASDCSEWSADYDYDLMRERIDKDYPEDWDPFAAVRSWGTGLDGQDREPYCAPSWKTGLDCQDGGQEINIGGQERRTALVDMISKQNAADDSRGTEQANSGPIARSSGQDTCIGEPEHATSGPNSRCVGGPDACVGGPDSCVGGPYSCVGGRNHQVGTKVANVASENSEIEVEDDETVHGGIVAPNLSPIGFSLGIEDEVVGAETVMTNSEEEKSYRNAIVVASNKNDQGQPSGQSSGGYGDMEWGDEEELFTDAAPFRDNAVAVATDEAHMNLRKGGDAIYVGRIFKDKNEMHKALCVYSIRRLFNFRVKASDTTRVIAICDDPKCRWRVYATNHKNSQTVEIRTVTLKHTCDVGSRSTYGKKATATILGDLLKAKYAHGKKGPRACELPDIVLAEMNVTISYMKAWNAKELAMHRARGDEESGYKFLSTYLYLLNKTNPGTISAVHKTLNRAGAEVFKYLFFAFGASIAGYKFLRKVIVIDGTQTKGKYQSCLVAASAQDGNYQIFPLAFGVIDSENTAGWTWFFTQLKEFVPDETDLVFVSDRHASIAAGLRSVYPLAKHGACAVHLFRNVKHQFNSELAVLTSNAARAYTVGGFRYWFRQIEGRNMKCAKYLFNIGFQHWTLAYFPGMRYNLMSSNISESLNAALQKAIDFPIVTLVEFIRTKLMGWFCTRREEANKRMTRCTPEIEELLIEHLREATDCAVVASSQTIFQVNDGWGSIFTVDLERKTCTCRVFDVLMVPCCHALAAVGIKDDISIYSLVGKCWFVEEWRKLWREKILPPPKEMDTDVPESFSLQNLKPPKTKRASGRPRTVRIPSRGEHKGKPAKKTTPNKCTTCGKNGHNRATCKNPL